MDELVREKYETGSPSQLTYIHIGKCGGETLYKALLASPVIKAQFANVKRVHVRKPYYQQNARYLIAVRNPVRRVLSAFNWRHHLVVETKVQEFRFSGEYEILQKYGTLNHLAECLYDDDGRLLLDTVKDWLAIHHLKEDISFYLSPLLERLRREQLFAVMAQETLNRDIEQFLGVSDVSSEHRYGEKTDAERLVLSDRAKANLRLFLKADYDCVQKLADIAGLTPQLMGQLMR